jgi:hypothetical protein
MKCRAKIIYFKKLDSNGNKRIAQVLNPDITDDQIQYFISQCKKNNKKWLEKVDLYAISNIMYECQGKVSVEVKAVDEPYMGGSSASLEVEYKCSICGCTYYKNMPDKHNINDWMNFIISDLP